MIYLEGVSLAEGVYRRRLVEWSGMRRLRLCLASTDSGRPGQPAAPTTGGRLHWLDGSGGKAAKAAWITGDEPDPRPEVTAPKPKVAAVERRKAARLHGFR